MARKWEYRVTMQCPTGANSPVAGSEEYAAWLNQKDEEGWEFVGYVPRFWNDRPTPQQFYVFRRPYKSKR